MDLAAFLTTLLERGVARVGTGFSPTPAQDADAERVLCDIDFFARANCPGDAPPLDMKAAMWGASILYRACQFLHIRDIGTEILVPAMREPCPSPPKSPATIYSVDLTLRYLPDLVRMAGKLAQDDPLVALLHALAREWPLSGVGSPDDFSENADEGAVASASSFAGSSSSASVPAKSPSTALIPLPERLDFVLSSRPLSALYRDRVIATGDVSRLRDPRVRAAVRAAIGGHPELCPALARALNPAEEKEETAAAPS